MPNTIKTLDQFNAWGDCFDTGATYLSVTIKEDDNISPSDMIEGEDCITYNIDNTKHTTKLGDFNSVFNFNLVAFSDKAIIIDSSSNIEKIKEQFESKKDSPLTNVGAVEEVQEMYTIAKMHGFPSEGQKPTRAYIHSGNVPFVNEGVKVGRNSPCPCGSGQKNKKCCLKNKK